MSKIHLREIKIGMNIKEAEKLIANLTKSETEAYDFGFDGGGNASVYSLENEPISALVPKRDSKEILAIITISQTLKTNNGLNPRSSVKEIIEKYPTMKIDHNLMMNWESMFDYVNNWKFVFITDENKRIGEYKENDVQSKPKAVDTKMDWIAIK